LAEQTFLQTIEQFASRLRDAAFHLEEQRKHCDHALGTMRDCSYQVSAAILAMSKEVRDRLDAFELTKSE
jgi:hypothetical protein